MRLNEEQRRALLKRVADVYEKVGVAGLAVGLFQHNELGAVLGIGFIAISLFLTYVLER